MKVNTKFNIGDKVYTYTSVFNSVDGIFVEEKIPSADVCIVYGINISVSSTSKVYIDYMLSNNELRSEDDLFTTKDAVKKFCDEPANY